jgi:hypothetical protein
VKARRRLAELLCGVLVERDAGGELQPPAGALATRVHEADGRQLAIVSRGDVLDVYFVTRKGDPVTFSCSARSVLRLAWWLLWRYWVVGTWCGMKLSLWSWTVRVLTTTLKTSAAVSSTSTTNSQSSA